MAVSNGLLKRIGLALGLALLACLIVIALLPTILKPVLNIWIPTLLGTPTTPAQVNIDSISWRGIQISYLYIPLTDNSSVKVDGLFVRYAFDDLLALRIDSVQVNSIQVLISDKKTLEITESAVDDLETIAKQNFNQKVSIPQFYEWLSLPLNSLTIDAITVQHPTATLHLSADITETDWRISGDAKLASFNTPWNLELYANKSDEGFSWLLMAYENSILLAQLYGLATQTNEYTQAQVRLSADLNALSGRIPSIDELGLPLENIILNATLNAPNHGVLPRDSIVDGQITISSTAKPISKHLTWQEGNWRVLFNKPQRNLGWTFKLESEEQVIAINAHWFGKEATLRAQQEVNTTCQATLTQCQGSLSATNWLFDLANNPVATFDITQEFQWDLDSTSNMEMSFNGQLTEPHFFIDENFLTKAHFNGKVLATLSDENEWQANSLDGFKARLLFNTTDQWQVSPLDLTLFKAVNIYGNISADKLRDLLQSDPIVIVTAPLSLHKTSKKYEQTTLNIAESTVSCRPIIGSESINATCNIHLKSEKSYWDGWPIPGIELDGPISVRHITQSPVINANLELSAANDNIMLRLNTQHNSAQKKGSLQWHLTDVPLNWDVLDLPEMQLLTRTQLVDGSISGQGWVDWKWNNQWIITPDISLRADNVNALYDNTMLFNAWSGLISLRRPAAADYLLDAQISGDSFNMGVPLTNIMARNHTRIAQDFSWAEFKVHELYAEVFGGSIYAPAFTYDTRTKNNSLHVRLSDIQLAQIVELEPEVGLNATGALDGDLPIEISEHGIQVPLANLHARAPGGIVQYRGKTADALAESNMSLGLTIDLLHNFHYDKLQTDVSYAPDGAFNLNLKFQGQNPNFFHGKPTHLNANLEYNLLDLLESLRITQELMDWPDTMLDNQPHK